MNKKDFIAEYQKKTGEGVKRCGELVEAFLKVVEETLEKDEEVGFLGWGKFEVSKKAERNGINPSTREKIVIPAKNVVKFKAGNKLNSKVNG